MAYRDLVFGGWCHPTCSATGVKLPASCWQPLGGKLTTGPVVGANTGGRSEMFVYGTDLGLWRRRQTAPSNG